jgi:ribonuclease P protein component
VRSVDFDRVLGTRSRVSTAHFAMHHLAEAPSSSRRAAPEKNADGELSTVRELVRAPSVDDSQKLSGGTVWLGLVVPKRHARRSVTRSLLKRQIRTVVAEQARGLAAGLWVVRMRAPFDRERFVSAASEALRAVVREELVSLVGAAARRSAAA